MLGYGCPGSGERLLSAAPARPAGFTDTHTRSPTPRFPCGQFGNQEPGHNDEILAGLAHVRPGRGFVPAFPMFAKVAVNGADADPIFTLLRKACKPGYVDELGTMEATQLNVAWSPVTYTDVSWNVSVSCPGASRGAARLTRDASFPPHQVREVRRIEGGLPAPALPPLGVVRGDRGRHPGLAARRARPPIGRPGPGGAAGARRPSSAFT